MCDPVTIAVIGAGVSVLGGGVGAYGQYQATQADASADFYSAQVAEQNAELSELQAQDVEATGARRSSRTALLASRFAAKQVGTFSASGVDVGASTSVQETIDTTIRAGAAEAIDTEHEAALEAWGLRREKGAFEAQAELARRRGETKRKLAPYIFFSSLLSSAGSTGSALAGAF